MPVLSSTAYNTAEDVLVRIRTILNDSEVAGGDVITDTAPFSFDLLNAGFERVQLELATVGVEVSATDVWLLALPTMPTIDPEARMIIDDTGTNIIYPSGTGNILSNTPQLPTNLIVPLKLWERQTGSSVSATPMSQPNDGLRSYEQSQFLRMWEWESDQLRFLGATQSQDLRIRYEKSLQKLAAPTDPIPIRGVVNAAAYFSATIFAESRGGTIEAAAKVHADEEILLLQQISARRRQRRQVRRQPYSGRGERQQFPYI